ncbi:hypothetical protein M885DRAFT_526134 [Pelagophyceae sp. CCMP2097]|nr:hypothetical protein M885DRAFT_526134 [Pelagophyceae sp. CCMP2097]
MSRRRGVPEAEADGDRCITAVVDEPDAVRAPEEAQLSQGQQAYLWCCSSTFTELARTERDRLPWFYSASSATYSVVGAALVLSGEAHFVLEGAVWCCVGVTSTMADVRHFGNPGLWAVIDVVFACTAIAITIPNSPPVPTACIFGTALFFFCRGQRRAPGDRRKLHDHALWHWTGQAGRLAVYLFMQRPQITS